MYVSLKVAKRFSEYRPWQHYSFSALAHKGYEFQKVNTVGHSCLLNGAERLNEYAPLDPHMTVQPIPCFTAKNWYVLNSNTFSS